MSYFNCKSKEKCVLFFFQKWFLLQCWWGGRYGEDILPAILPTATSQVVLSHAAKKSNKFGQKSTLLNLGRTSGAKIFQEIWQICIQQHSAFRTFSCKTTGFQLMGIAISLHKNNAANFKDITCKHFTWISSENISDTIIRQRWFQNFAPILRKKSTVKIGPCLSISSQLFSNT